MYPTTSTSHGGSPQRASGSAQRQNNRPRSASIRSSTGRTIRPGSRSTALLFTAAIIPRRVAMRPASEISSCTGSGDASGRALPCRSRSSIIVRRARPCAGETSTSRIPSMASSPPARCQCNSPDKGPSVAEPVSRHTRSAPSDGQDSMRVSDRAQTDAGLSRVAGPRRRPPCSGRTTWISPGADSE
ncbi:hypothetical protein ACN28S_08555 [Cystobacter fuscus]